MSDEENAVVEPDELTMAKKEIEDLKASLSEKETEVSTIQGELTEKVSLIDSQAQDLATLQEAQSQHEAKVEDLSATLAHAIGKYQVLAAAQVPQAPAGMITGATIADIDAAVETAKSLVESVRGSLEESAVAVVPVGAPERSGPDLSSMTPKEKIQYAIKAEGEK